MKQHKERQQHETNTTSTQDTKISSVEKDDPSDSNTSVMAGITRGILYPMQKPGFIRAMLTKKAFLHTVETHSSSYPSPVGNIRKQNGSTIRGVYLYRAADMIKGTILGVAVFGIYDYLILRRRESEELKEGHHGKVSKLVRSKTKGGQHDVKLRLDSMVSLNIDKTLPPYMHVQAGFLAGLIHSFVLDAWEIGEYAVHHTYPSMSHLRRTVNVELILRRALHHSLGYAMLFGCYEGLRQSLTQLTASHMTSNPHDLKAMLEKLGQHPERKMEIDPSATTHSVTMVYDITAIPLSIAFLSGGLAGQAHYVLTHYLHQWRIGSVAERTKRHAETGHRKRPVMKWKHVHIRPLLSTFLPAALSFVAFQYAGELTEQWVKHETERRDTPRSQMVIGSSL